MVARKKSRRSKTTVRIASGGVEMITHSLMLCRGSGKMGVPQGGGHMRSIEFILPPCQSDPVVSATIYATNSPGTSFTLYSIKKNRYSNYTQVAIGATWTLSGTREITVPIAKELEKFSIHCDFVAYARPVVGGNPKARSKTKK